MSSLGTTFITKQTCTEVPRSEKHLEILFAENCVTTCLCLVMAILIQRTCNDCGKIFVPRAFSSGHVTKTVFVYCVFCFLLLAKLIVVTDL